MVTKEKILESLYTHCQNRILTTKDILRKMEIDLKIQFTPSIIEQLITHIRPYKNTFLNLEKTVNYIYEILIEKEKIDLSEQNDLFMDFKI